MQDRRTSGNNDTCCIFKTCFTVSALSRPKMPCIYKCYLFWFIYNSRFTKRVSSNGNVRHRQLNVKTLTPRIIPNTGWLLRTSRHNPKKEARKCLHHLDDLKLWIQMVRELQDTLELRVSGGARTLFRRHETAHAVNTGPALYSCWSTVKVKKLIRSIWMKY